MRRFRLVTAGLVLTVVAYIALTRDLLLHPNLSLGLLLLMVAPFVLDMRYPSWVGSPVVGLGAIALVLASASALMVVDPATHDFVAIVFVILAARVAAEAPIEVGIVIAALAIAMPLVLAVAGLSVSSANLIVGTAFAWFAGYEVRSQQRLTRALVDAQIKLADQAAVTERQRIAREVHDLVAHTLSVTMLHLTGARLALQDADVTEATAALAEAERAGREAVREMRQAVGLLGTPSTGHALPGAADVPELIASYQNAGLPIALDIQGDLGAISDDAGLALYRITQESLSNAAKHAPSAQTLVAIEVGSKDVTLTVRNDVNAPSGVPRGGRGLPGMADRAALLGGSLSAGSVGDAWEVRAVLPCGPA
jgi:signal transduction histidine kinase